MKIQLIGERTYCICNLPIDVNLRNLEYEEIEKNTHFKKHLFA